MANTFKFGAGNWAYKDGKVLAYNDENNNFKPLPFDFTRASSATRVNSAGLIEEVGQGVPRIDYLNDSNGALLLEPSRTNLLSYSDDLDSWGKTNVSVTSNSTISPDGTQNADTITVTAETTVEAVAAGFSADGSSNYTISSFIKKSSTSVSVALKIRDTLGSGTTHCLVVFNTLNANVTASIGTYSITSFNDDWWYVTATSTTPPTAGTRKGIIRLTDEIVGTEVVAWGLQIEAGSYATSYIPTSGSSVTRAADDVDTDYGNKNTLSDEVSVYFNLLPQVSTASNTNKCLSFGFNSSSNGDSYAVLRFNGTNWSSRIQGTTGNNFDSLGVSLTTEIKAVMVLTQSGYSLYANGSVALAGGSYSGTAPTINSVAFVEILNDTDDRGIYKIKELKVYNTALTEQEAIALTS